MFDMNGDMFKPIVGAKLIREEAEKAAKAMETEGNQPTEAKIPESKALLVVPETRTETSNITQKGPNKEIL